MTNHSDVRRRITVKGQQVTEQDWRGLLAILATIGYFLIVSLVTLRYDFAETVTAIGLLSTMEMLVLNWYFKAKEEGSDVGKFQ